MSLKLLIRSTTPPLLLLLCLTLLLPLSAPQVRAAEGISPSSDELEVVLEHRFASGGQMGDIQGNYAYVRTYDTLQVVDIRDPAEPSVIGSVELSVPVHHVVAFGQYAYVSSDAGLHIINIANPALPRELSLQPIESSVRKMALKEAHLYLDVREEGLHIFDLSNPEQPTMVGQFTEGRLGLIAGDYLYYGKQGFDMYRSTFYVVDLSDPGNPVVVGAMDTEGTVDSLARVGDHVYVAGEKEGLRVSSPFFAIIDVSDPSSPTPVASDYEPGFVSDMAIWNGYAYFVTAHGPSYGYDWRTLTVVNLSDPRAPQTVDEFEVMDTIVGVRAAGDHLYLTYDFQGIEIFDVTSPRDPVVAGLVDVVSMPTLTALGEHLYTAGDTWRSGGVRIIEHAEGVPPEILGGVAIRYDYDSLNITALAVATNHLYLASYESPIGPGGECDASASLGIFDVSDPGNPRKLSGWTWWAEECHWVVAVQDIVVQEPYAYVVIAPGLSIFDVNNPASPYEVNTFDGNVRSVAVQGQYAYLRTSDNALTILDITDPANPTVVVENHTVENVPGGLGSSIVVDQGYAYLGTTNGLVIVDVSNVEAPQTVGVYSEGSGTREVAIVENYAFLAEGENGFRVLDISDPTQPTALAHRRTLDSADSLVADHEHVYVADTRGGLLTYRYFEVSNKTYMPLLAVGGKVSTASNGIEQLRISTAATFQ